MQTARCQTLGDMTQLNKAVKAELKNLLREALHGLNLYSMPVRDPGFFERRLEEGYASVAFVSPSAGANIWVNDVKLIGCWVFVRHPSNERYFLYERLTKRTLERHLVGSLSMQRECDRKWLTRHLKAFGAKLAHMGTIEEILEGKLIGNYTAVIAGPLLKKDHLLSARQKEAVTKWACRAAEELLAHEIQPMDEADHNRT